MPNILHYALASEADDEFAGPLHLRVLGELAYSLDASRQALLSGDVGQLEQLTEEQSLLWARILPLAQADYERLHTAGVRADADGASALLAAQKRILHLARVQQAILRRAGQRSRIVSNLLAGPDSEYAPGAQDHAIECHAPGAKQR